MKTTITKNEEKNGIEVRFDEKPAEKVLNELKINGWRWSNFNKCWYNKATEESEIFANEILVGMLGAKETTAAEIKESETTEKTNKYGVKVGDLFVCSWGYEQTNIDFYQVVEVMNVYVKIIAVNPKQIHETAVSGMSRDVNFEIPNEILPAQHSIFIKNEESGDRVKVKLDYGNEPCFDIEGRYRCRKYHGEKLYESWYA